MIIEKRIRKSFIRQLGINDCGKACLGMCIRYYGGKVNLDSIHRHSGSTKTGTTLLGLFHAATYFGFNAEAYEVELENMDKNLTLPAILHVRSNSGQMHFIVLYKIVRDKYIIADPGVGIEVWDKTKLEKKWESRIALQLKPNENFEKSIERQSSIRPILEWIKPDKSMLLAIVFIGIVIAIISLSTAIFSQQLIDVILPSGKFKHLIYGVCVFAFLLVVKMGISYVRAKLLFIQAKDLNIRLIRKFFNKLLELPKSFFDSKKTGELVSRINDTGRIQSTLSELFGMILIEFLVALTSVVAIFYFDWRIGVIVSMVIPIYLLLHFRFQDSIIRKQKEVMTSYAMNESNYIDTVTGIQVIKSTNNHSLFQQITNLIFGGFQEQVFNLNQHRVKLGLLSEAFHLLFYFVIIMLGGYLYFNGRLALGELIAVISLTSAIGPSLHKIALFNVGLQGAKVAFERMEEFSEVKSELNSGSEIINNTITVLKLEHTCFTFPGKHSLLNKIELEIKIGNLISLIGESGVGKSTIAQLLLRFYQPTSGRIKMNDQDIQDLDLRWYRENVSYMGQEPKIFNNSLFFNICLSTDSEEYQKVISWCTENGFDEIFKQFPQGYLSLLGEEGINLSGGQQQLVCLARVLYRKPRFLILDEATSALDRKTELRVLNLLQRIKLNTGILLITHRINLAMTTDYIYRIENGEIINQGNPELIIEKDEWIRSFFHDLSAFKHQIS